MRGVLAVVDRGDCVTGAKPVGVTVLVGEGVVLFLD